MDYGREYRHRRPVVTQISTTTGLHHHVISYPLIYAHVHSSHRRSTSPKSPTTPPVTLINLPPPSLRRTIVSTFNVAAYVIYHCSPATSSPLRQYAIIAGSVATTNVTGRVHLATTARPSPPPPATQTPIWSPATTRRGGGAGSASPSQINV